MLLSIIGENIQALRKAKGLTQEQLAELVSLSPVSDRAWRISVKI